MVCYEPSGACVIVDPGCNTPAEEQKLVEFINSTKLSPEAIINTHGHIDHILGVRFCQKKWNVKFFMHSGDLQQVKAAPSYADMFGLSMAEAPIPDGFLEDGDTFTLGEENLRIIHVPGHSPGSIAFYSENARFVIVGDVLFSGSIGRTDLPGGDFQTLISSIRGKLFQLPPDTIVWPGHGPSTTVGIEMAQNPYLQ